jgi:uncharacterized coiled-coil protein SlyX
MDNIKSFETVNYRMKHAESEIDTLKRDYNKIQDLISHHDTIIKNNNSILTKQEKTLEKLTEIVNAHDLNMIRNQENIKCFIENNNKELKILSLTIDKFSDKLSKYDNIKHKVIGGYIVVSLIAGIIITIVLKML